MVNALTLGIAKIFPPRLCDRSILGAARPFRSKFGMELPSGPLFCAVVFGSDHVINTG